MTFEGAEWIVSLAVIVLTASLLYLFYPALSIKLQDVHVKEETWGEKEDDGSSEKGTNPMIRFGWCGCTRLWLGLSVWGWPYLASCLLAWFLELTMALTLWLSIFRSIWYSPV